MTLEISHRTSPRRSQSRIDVMDTLKRLPTRRLADPATVSSPLQWHLVAIDRYEVRRGPDTLGFVDVVGAVFVVLIGCRYDRAVEIAQVLVFDDALAALQTGTGRTRT